jgi:hypothetical protein
MHRGTALAAAGHGKQAASAVLESGTRNSLFAMLTRLQSSLFAVLAAISADFGLPANLTALVAIVRCLQVQPRVCALSCWRYMYSIAPVPQPRACFAAIVIPAWRNCRLRFQTITVAFLMRWPDAVLSLRRRGTDSPSI